jgi:APA family basic amino acid/polyamine antiporter
MTPPGLARRLGTGDAVVLGLGAMLGAGIFAAPAPAAQAAGSWLPVAVLVAGFVAWCNATSTAALAATMPQAGGTYVYAGRLLGPAWGHLAGWGFVTGKTASCAAMALTVGSYAWPGHPGSPPP